MAQPPFASARGDDMTGVACLILYVMLSIAAWTLLFMRATRRRTLLNLARNHFESSAGDAEWTATTAASWSYIADMRRVRFIRNHLALASDAVATAYGRFRTASRIAYVAIALLIGLALFGYKICV